MLQRMNLSAQEDPEHRVVPKAGEIPMCGARCGDNPMRPGGIGLGGP